MAIEGLFAIDVVIGCCAPKGLLVARHDIKGLPYYRVSMV